MLMEKGEFNERIRINPSISETHYCVNYTVTEQIETSEDKKYYFRDIMLCIIWDKTLCYYRSKSAITTQMVLYSTEVEISSNKSHSGSNS